jgi:hypothetical protein
MDGGEWSASFSGCFNPGEVSPGTHWMAGWLGSTAGLKTWQLLAKEKFPTFMEPEYSQSHSQKPTTEPHYEPVQSPILLPTLLP